MLTITAQAKHLKAEAQVIRSQISANYLINGTSNYFAWGAKVISARLETNTAKKSAKSSISEPLGQLSSVQAGQFRAKFCRILSLLYETAWWHVTLHIRKHSAVRTISSLHLQQWPRRHVQWNVSIRHCHRPPCHGQVLFRGCRRGRHTAVFCLQLPIRVWTIWVVTGRRYMQHGDGIRLST